MPDQARSDPQASPAPAPPAPPAPSDRTRWTMLLALISAHMALVVFHKHTQFPGPGRTETNVVGYPLFPVYAAKAGGFRRQRVG